MCPVDGDEPPVYTMRTLNQRAGEVMAELQKYQRPGYITKHGRFIAKIIPFEPAKVKSAVQAAIARPMGQPNRRPDADDARPLTYTMRYLNQQTARVMAEIQKNGRSAYITKQGRFIAEIVPLEPGEIESAVLAAMARDIGEQTER